VDAAGVRLGRGAERPPSFATITAPFSGSIADGGRMVAGAVGERSRLGRGGDGPLSLSGSAVGGAPIVADAAGVWLGRGGVGPPSWLSGSTGDAGLMVAEAVGMRCRLGRGGVGPPSTSLRESVVADEAVLCVRLGRSSGGDWCARIVLSFGADATPTSLWRPDGAEA
jgi:hypothetical protein